MTTDFKATTQNNVYFETFFECSLYNKRGTNLYTILYFHPIIRQLDDLIKFLFNSYFINKSIVELILLIPKLDLVSRCVSILSTIHENVTSISARCGSVLREKIFQWFTPPVYRKNSEFFRL